VRPSSGPALSDAHRYRHGRGHAEAGRHGGDQGGADPPQPGVSHQKVDSAPPPGGESGRRRQPPT
jgi:hypothetical protein